MTGRAKIAGFCPALGRSRVSPWVIIAVGSIAVTGGSLQAETTESPAELLTNVRAQIEALETALAGDKVEINRAHTLVAKVEKALVEAQARQTEYTEQLKRKKTTVDELRRRRDNNRRLIQQQMDVVRQTIRARYALWREPKIKLLLNQHAVNAIGRNIRYHDYFIKAYSKQIADVRQEQKRQDALASALKLETDKLRLTQVESDVHLASLIALQKKYDTAVDILQQRSQDRNHELARFRLDEQRLQSLVQEIQTEVAQGPARGAPGPFSRLKGSLNWPTTGKVQKATGNGLQESGAKWRGVFVESEAGAPVRAVGSGLVVFADWFRNLGLLIIIDHGDGYMSLYGHNQSVQVAVGTRVQSGQIISHVSDPRGRGDSGLYFEIRHEGEPQDPRQWCVSR